MKISTRRSTTLLLGLLVCVTGCYESGESAATAKPPEPVAPEVLQASLAAADRADGTEDRVVARCAGCALHMEGQADHAMELAGYELRFCSGECRDGFRDGAEQKVAALVIPEE